MVFKKSRKPTALSMAASELGLEMQGKDVAQGYVDEVAVVVANPSAGVDMGHSPGAWILVGPTAENWINNDIPDKSNESTEKIDEELIVGECAGWLGVDVLSRKAYGDLDSDDVLNAVSSAIGCFRGVD